MTNRRIRLPTNPDAGGRDMGLSVCAACPCGYEPPLLMIGGGMMNFQEFCAFPAYCAEGGHLVTVNMFDDPPRCPRHARAVPRPFDDAELRGDTGGDPVATWTMPGSERHLVLTDGRYLCPKCHGFSLRFSDGGMLWD
jgi:hypothetical protein